MCVVLFCFALVEVLIWDVQQIATRSSTGPILNYLAQGAVAQVQWSELQPDWIAVCHDKTLELLRVG